MTYTEKYSKAESFEELSKMMGSDASIALLIGTPERIAYIKEAGEEVCRNRGWLDKEEDD